MKAKIKELQSGLNIAHRKEHLFTGGYKVINKDFKVIVDLRFYWGDTRCYCCTWIHGKKREHYGSGSGYAGGYGYCKESTAAQKALDSCGIELSENIAGVGHTAIEEALQAIGRTLGYRKIGIIKCHA